MLRSALMHSAKARNQLIHVVDLDPYGTAAPFIDAAVQTVTDDGARSVSLLPARGLLMRTW